ncbi:MAG: hypothetical protein HYZ50_08760 [Deltaproteobacteria bacterium]|nr:hypothetical protein [Deltaproteobacteria bacterium]
MRVRSTLRPHQRGAKQLLAQYGNRLVCVRYRYDELNKKRYKTVELIVEEKAWTPQTARRQANSLVSVRVTAAEVALRQQIKRAGGKWNPHRRVWEVRYDQVLALGLADRIVEDRKGTTGKDLE